DLDQVAACDREAAPAQYASHRFAVVEPNRIVTAMRSRDQARDVGRHSVLMSLSVCSEFPLRVPSRAQLLDLGRANAIVEGPPAGIVSRKRYDDAIVVDRQIRMMVLPVRQVCDRVDERDRL